VVNSGEVFAGDSCTTPAETTWSMNVFETPEDAAPTMALLPSAMSDVADWLAMSVVASPESLSVTVTVMPALASLMSCSARWTPANSGGPRTARLPVCGRIVPILRSRSPLSVVPPPVPPPLAEQPARTRAPATATVTALKAVRADREREVETLPNALMVLLMDVCGDARECDA
jgi:hypothetical protein